MRGFIKKDLIVFFCMQTVLDFVVVVLKPVWDQGVCSTYEHEFNNVNYIY